MILRPADLKELTEGLLQSASRAEQAPSFDLRALNRVLEYTPEDMTVTAEAGLTLLALQAHLAQRGQWLPIDPPNPESQTIADVINCNSSGPGRFGYGTIQDNSTGFK